MVWLTISSVWNTPPSTTVSPLPTSTSVLSAVVSMVGICEPNSPLMNSPTESWLISSFISTRPSGVMCGVTSSCSTASLNSTVVSPEAADVW